LLRKVDKKGREGASGKRKVQGGRGGKEGAETTKQPRESFHYLDLLISIINSNRKTKKKNLEGGKGEQKRKSLPIPLIASLSWPAKKRRFEGRGGGEGRKKGEEKGREGGELLMPSYLILA